MLTNGVVFQMLEQQEPEEWEKGMSTVQLGPDGSIMPVPSGRLMPVVEDEDEDVSVESRTRRLCVFCCCLLLLLSSFAAVCRASFLRMHTLTHMAMRVSVCMLSCQRVLNVICVGVFVCENSPRIPGLIPRHA